MSKNSPKASQYQTADFLPIKLLRADFQYGAAHPDRDIARLRGAVRAFETLPVIERKVPRSQINDLEHFKKTPAPGRRCEVSTGGCRTQFEVMLLLPNISKAYVCDVNETQPELYASILPFPTRRKTT